MKKILVLAIALVAVGLTAFTACSGKKDNSGTGTASTATSSENISNGNDSLFDIPHDKITFGENVDKTIALAEIPAEMLKGVGELNSAEVWADTITDFKYTIVLKFYVKSSENAVKMLTDFYKSKGATVEETGNSYNPYSVKFAWGESTEVKFGSFEGQGRLDLQFSVIK